MNEHIKIITLAVAKSARWWPIGWVLNWFLWAPLYSTHSRLWDFVLMSVMGIVSLLAFTIGLYWKLLRLVEQGKLWE